MCQPAPPGVNTHEICKGSRNHEQDGEPSVDDAGLTAREDGKERGRAGGVGGASSPGTFEKVLISP